MIICLRLHHKIFLFFPFSNRHFAPFNRRLNVDYGSIAIVLCALNFCDSFCLEFSSVRYVNSMPVSSVIFRLHRNVSFVPFLLSISLVAFVFFFCWLSIRMQTSGILAFDSIHYFLIIVAIRFVYSLDLC